MPGGLRSEPARSRVSRDLDRLDTPAFSVKAHGTIVNAIDGQAGADLNTAHLAFVTFGCD